MSPQLTVWYNTKCPVCNAGIDWQRSRLVRAARAGVIEFRDINLEPDALARFGAALRMCAAGCTASMPMAACMSAPIAPSPFGARLRATAGSPGSPACRASSNLLFRL